MRSWPFPFPSSTGMQKTGGCLASISAFHWPAQESSTHSCPVRCSAARKACASHSMTTWNRYTCKWLQCMFRSSVTVWLGKTEALSSKNIFLVHIEEGSSEDGVLPGVDFRSLLAAPSSQPYSEENNLWPKWPQPLWTAQVGTQIEWAT